MTTFDHGLSDNWCIRTSHRGVRVRSTHSIFVYMQDICTIIDSSYYTSAFNSFPFWEKNNMTNSLYVTPYVSPLLTNVFRSEKNPVTPLSSQTRDRFPDSFEEWWFDRCATISVGGILNGEEYRNVRYVTALEDSTVVTYTFDVLQPQYSQITNSVILQKEETVFLHYEDPLSNEEYLTLKTNCKPVICMSGLRGSGVFANFLSNIGGDGLGHIYGSYHPFTNSEIHQGLDFLCKKLVNDRFDKGIYYLKIRECSDPLTPLWSDNVDRYMYNEVISGDDFELFMNIPPNNFLGNSQTIRNYNPITGSHRGYWGSVSTYVDVPYTFLRSTSPINFDIVNGPFFFIYKESGPAYPIYGYMPDSIGFCTLYNHIPIRFRAAN